MDLWEGAEVSAEAGKAIASAMKVVACADGDLHERELALIDAFEAELPSDTEPGPHALDDEAAKDALLTSLVMVALADGKVSENEERVIRNLAAEHGFGDAAVTERIDAVKRLFIEQFSGVRIFRDAVEQIAADLGVKPDPG